MTILGRPRGRVRMTSDRTSIEGKSKDASAADAGPARHRISRIAHRAGNDREALRLATEAGVDWIEIDLWSSFGRLVARHERGVWRLPFVYEGWHVRPLRRPPM